ncbi:stage 0 sporulation family protein [Anaerolineales bacterium HSG6]|nr:stage 0 sporulation family protein [Anaerolineales bacterium HSG6]MDM8531968.1 stage 0 sporulation family protein [Anaerolineales bacterium HSG25]
MPKIVGIRFNPVTKIYYFDPQKISGLKAEDRVIVQTARGIELGKIVIPIRHVPAKEIKGELKPVVRRATPLDLIMAQDYKASEASALETCKQLVKDMDVPMKVVQASYSFDGSRLMFAFTSDQRVDFRDLVKELAKSLKTRIEMKQIGTRDETKVIDGYGRCGRQLCCSSWLTEFHPVSIRMAKQQGLPLAPSEISGVCGRLLCCLAYEDKMYVEIRKKLPKVGKRVQLAEGQGVIRGLNILKEMVIVELEDNQSYVEVSTEEIELIKPGSKPKPKPKPKEPATEKTPVKPQQGERSRQGEKEKPKQREKRRRRRPPKR